MNSVHSFALLAATGSLLLAGASLGADSVDDRIQSSARDSYIFRTCLKDDSINTKSQAGAVTLVGTVTDKYHKTLAEYAIEALPDVKSIDNQLTVLAEDSSEDSDRCLSTKVKLVLCFHRNVDAQGIEVSVKDGIVGLRGEASSSVQQGLIAEYAKDVEGIKRVMNEMTIARPSVKQTENPSENLDDASITAQIRWSLLAHRSTSGLIKPRIETTEGAVTISGLARNEVEKSLVTRHVSGIKGVSSVINTMTVEAVVSKESARPRPVQNLRIVGN